MSEDNPRSFSIGANDDQVKAGLLVNGALREDYREYMDDAARKIISSNPTKEEIRQHIRRLKDEQTYDLEERLTPEAQAHKALISI